MTIVFPRGRVILKAIQVLPETHVATKLTSKGQVTIPKPVREALGLRAGTSVEFVLNQEGQFVVRAARKPRRAVRGRFAALRGIGTVKMTTDEILALTRGD